MSVVASGPLREGYDENGTDRSWSQLRFSLPSLAELISNHGEQAMVEVPHDHRGPGLPEDQVGYLDADAVERRLAERGIYIEPSSTVTLLKTSSRLPEGGVRSMFDEIRTSEQQMIRLNARKLFQGQSVFQTGAHLLNRRFFFVLLQRTICLPTGPAYISSEIDGAIRTGMVVDTDKFLKRYKSL
jgi:hypothetical protein